jgi:hypothetical protein
MHVSRTVFQRARHVRLALVAVASTVALLRAADLRAQTITQGSNGNVTYGFGVPSAATIGQTFAGGAGALTSFSFWLSNEFGVNTPSASALQIRGYVMAWTGTRAVGPILYASATRTGPTAASQQYQFVTPNIPMTPGARYVAFLSTSGLFSNIVPRPAQAAVWLSDNALSGGGLVFTDNGDDLGLVSSQDWDYTGDPSFQSQFQVAFSGTVVPEPATLVLMASGLLALGGWSAARQRQIHAASVP